MLLDIAQTKHVRLNNVEDIVSFIISHCESVKDMIPEIIIVIYIISGIKAILQDSSVKIADDEGVSPSSSVTHEFPVICFSPRVMYNILSTAANY
jgi:hypothetical protein